VGDKTGQDVGGENPAHVWVCVCAYMSACACVSECVPVLLPHSLPRAP